MALRDMPLLEDEKSKKEREITPLVKKACELWNTGEYETISSLARHLNCSKEHLGKQFGLSHVQAYLVRGARDTLMRAAGQAANVKVELMKSAQSEKVRSAAASEVLALAGISAKQTNSTTINNNVNVSAGYVIDLSDNPKPAALEVHATSVRPDDDEAIQSLG